jgi:multidrug efflux pump subunit AcrB
LIIDDTISRRKYFPAFPERPRSALPWALVRESFPAITGLSAATTSSIPFAFLSGVTGAFFKSLSLTMVLALLVSYALALLLAPLLASRFITAEELEKEASRAAQELRLLTLYKTALRFLLRRRLIIFPVALAIIAGGYAIYTQLGSSFMPEMDEGAFVLDYVSPPGTSLNETHRMLLDVEKLIMDIPEV